MVFGVRTGLKEKAKNFERKMNFESEHRRTIQGTVVLRKVKQNIAKLNMNPYDILNAPQLM